MKGPRPVPWRAARYLLRFDDLCPTMNWRVWDKVEGILERAQVRPLLAVIPDNRDPALMLESAAGNFWERVRDWQGRGWSIGLHGYQHRYVSTSAGLLRLNARSEFAGLPLAEQKEKLRAALGIFWEERIHPEFWVAPAHSFDETTLQLLPQFGIEVLSDGFSWRPGRESGLIWIPQQLWRFWPAPPGVWTVCLHHNNWSERDLARFELDLLRYREHVCRLQDILSCPVPERNVLDRSFAWGYRLLVKGRRQISRGGTGEARG